MARKALDDGSLLQVFSAHPSRALHIMEVLAALDEGPTSRHRVNDALAVNQLAVAFKTHLE